MTETRHSGGETIVSPAAQSKQRRSGETTAVPQQIPDIPTSYHAPANLIGRIPVEVAEGFEVTRIPNTPEAIAEAKTRGQVVIHAGDRNPMHPDEPLVANETFFQQTPEGYLTYRGDLLVVWAVSYAEAFRTAQQEAARRATKTGVTSRSVPIERASFPDEGIMAAMARENAL